MGEREDSEASRASSSDTQSEVEKYEVGEGVDSHEQTVKYVQKSDVWSNGVLKKHRVMFGRPTKNNCKEVCVEGSRPDSQKTNASSAVTEEVTNNGKTVNDLQLKVLSYNVLADVYF